MKPSALELFLSSRDGEEEGGGWRARHGRRQRAEADKRRRKKATLVSFLKSNASYRGGDVLVPVFLALHPRPGTRTSPAPSHESLKSLVSSHGWCGTFGGWVMSVLWEVPPVAKMSAAPGHSAQSDETRLNGIVLNVFHDAAEVVFISDVAVEIIILPECSVTPQNIVDLPGGVALPGFQNLPQRFLPDFYEGVDVVRHNDSREEAVMPTIMVPQASLHYLGDARVAQVTSPITQIKIAFELSLLFQVILKSQNCGPFAAPFGRERVGEPVSYVLLSPWRIKVGQVLRGVPALKPLGRLLRCKRLGPALFAVDQLPKINTLHTGAGTSSSPCLSCRAPRAGDEDIPAPRAR